MVAKNRLMVHSITLKSKLILSFIGFIIISTTVLGIISTRMTTGVIEDTAAKSAIQNSEQIMKSLDVFLGMLLKLSEYPISDEEIRVILAKDYTKVSSPDFERKKDFSRVNTFLYEKTNSFSNAINSSVLYYEGDIPGFS